MLSQLWVRCMRWSAGSSTWIQAPWPILISLTVSDSITSLGSLVARQIGRHPMFWHLFDAYNHLLRSFGLQVPWSWRLCVFCVFISHRKLSVVLVRSFQATLLQLIRFCWLLEVEVLHLTSLSLLLRLWLILVFSICLGINFGFPVFIWNINHF